MDLLKLIVLQKAKQPSVIEDIPIEYTLTTNPAEFTTTRTVPLTGLTADIAFVQSGSGTPSQSNICPISGLTGITAQHGADNHATGTSYGVVFPALTTNMFNYANANFQFGYFDGSGVYQNDPASSYNATYIEVEPNTKYRLEYYDDNQSKYVRSVYYYDADKGFISRFTPGYTYTTRFTTPANCYYIRFQINSLADTTRYLMAKGEDRFKFSPFCNTLYGGTYDFLTGTLTVTHFGITMKISDYSTKTAYDNGVVSYDYNQVANVSVKTNINQKCSIARYYYGGYSEQTDHFYVYKSSDAAYLTRIRLYLVGDNIDETQSFTCVAELEEPYTIQFDPVTITALDGSNTIYVNGASSLTTKYMK